MRKRKLFAITVNDKKEAEALKIKLSGIKVEDDTSKNISYSGYITCDIEELEDEVELMIYTFLEKDEFAQAVFDCCHTPKFFQFERKELI